MIFNRWSTIATGIIFMAGSRLLQMALVKVV